MRVVAVEVDEHKALPSSQEHAAALYFMHYNFIRVHQTLGTTPAVAAGLEEKAWGLEQVVEMTEAYWLRKR